MELNQDFREFFEFLNKNEVRYLIVGGYAVAFHGHPRYTKDIDVWIDATPENAARLIQAVRDFGFASIGLRIEDFLAPGYTIQLGVVPNRIDLLTSARDLDFELCFASRVEAVVGGVTVHMIGLDHLKQNKRAAGRSQDLADLEHLE
jgi:predicted nucleotidyltransferase